MGGFGKDGTFYKDNNELNRANSKWLQQERQNELLAEQNRLLKLQAERMKNGGITDSEKYAQIINGWIASGKRIAPLYLLVTLIIGIVLLCGGNVISPCIGLYVLSSGFIIEGLSVIIDRKKKNEKRGVYEIIMLLIGILLIVVTFLSISTLKNLIPMLKSDTYTLKRKSFTYSINESNIRIKELFIDGENMNYKDDIELNKKNNIKLKIKYYYEGNSKNILTKEIDFNPREYFDKFDNEHTIKDISKINIVYISDLL